MNMKWTNERKVLAGVLTVALLALVVNAFIPGGGLAGPAKANAASNPVSPPKAKTSAAASPAAVDLTLAEPVGPSLAQRLAKFAKTDHAAQVQRDAFAPSHQWLEHAGMVQRSGVKQAQGTQAFAAHHHLMAVVGSGNGQGGLAVVDNRSLEVGDRLDGFTLVKLGRRSAVFAGAGGRVTLTLGKDH